MQKHVIELSEDVRISTWQTAAVQWLLSHFEVNAPSAFSSGSSGSGLLGWRVAKDRAPQPKTLRMNGSMDMDTHSPSE